MRYTDFDVVWIIWEQDENPTCRCCMWYIVLDIIQQIHNFPCRC